jgi:hypothetical protein
LSRDQRHRAGFEIGRTLGRRAWRIGAEKAPYHRFVRRAVKGVWTALFETLAQADGS